MNLEICTEDECEINICKKYWLVNEDGKFKYAVKEIAEEQSVTSREITNIVELASYVWLDDIYCVRCKVPIIFVNRAKYNNRKLFESHTCEDCILDEQVRLKNEYEIKKDKFIQDEIKKLVEKPKAQLENMKIKSRIYLLSAIKSLGCEELTSIGPVEDFPPCSLSPNYDFDLAIIRYLLEEDLIYITPDSLFEGAGFDDVDLECCWQSLVFGINLDSDQIELLMSSLPSAIVSENHISKEFFLKINRELQLQECLAFLVHSLEYYQLFFTPGVKTRQVLERCLKSCSVAQVCFFIWAAAKDAAAYYMTGKVFRKQAANSVVGNISRLLEERMKSGKDIMAFKRNHNLPQSALSRIVYNNILGTDDGGFHLTTNELLRELELNS